jgi:hypothetical protein
METLAMLGTGGGEARWLADRSLIVPSGDTRRVQEIHLVALHMICELVEKKLEAAAAADLRLALAPGAAGEETYADAVGGTG